MVDYTHLGFFRIFFNPIRPNLNPKRITLIPLQQTLIIRIILILLTQPLPLHITLLHNFLQQHLKIIINLKGCREALYHFKRHVLINFYLEYFGYLPILYNLEIYRFKAVFIKKNFDFIDYLGKMGEGYGRLLRQRWTWLVLILWGFLPLFLEYFDLQIVFLGRYFDSVRNMNVDGEFKGGTYRSWWSAVSMKFL